MPETIYNWVNICIKKENKILLLNRQYDDYKGWIYPGGKVEFPESFIEAARREVKEETGLTAKRLVLKGIAGFTNPLKNERFVYYNYLCDDFEGEVLLHSPEGDPKWWEIEALDNIPMQKDIRKRLPLFLQEETFEQIHYWDENKGQIGYTKTYLSGETQNNS